MNLPKTFSLGRQVIPSGPDVYPGLIVVHGPSATNCSSSPYLIVREIEHGEILDGFQFDNRLRNKFLIKNSEGKEMVACFDPLPGPELCFFEKFCK